MGWQAGFLQLGPEGGIEMGEACGMKGWLSYPKCSFGDAEWQVG